MIGGPAVLQPNDRQVERELDSAGSRAIEGSAPRQIFPSWN